MREAVSAAAVPHVESGELCGRTLGRYRLVERVASGGMGDVYRGVRTDGEFEQQVAVKIVKRGTDTDEIVRRFRIERQTLANLSHPNIAALIDGGATDDGRPYLVMEFVSGAPIDRYVLEHELSVNERVRLFVQVCRAVQHAHQNMVIHRDLKPGNIFVTADGVPKLLDFGIATVLETAEGSAGAPRTIPEQRRLTPEYASPEQVQGLPVTAASDVYSLGVVLYELLTRQRPYTFQTRSTAEVERVVCRELPAAPSQAAGKTIVAPSGAEHGSHRTFRADASGERLRKQLRGDLDTIVLMALRKEAPRRYATAEQLAADLERYLDERPVLARKDSAWYRARKFVRRNRVTSLLAGAVALSMLIGITGVLLQARETARERDGAFAARDEAEEIVRFLRDVLASADPSNAGGDTTIGRVLDEAALRLDTELTNRPLVHAAVLASLGTSYLGLGQLEKAEKLVRRAMDIRLEHLPPDHHDVAESMLDLAGVCYATQRFEEAETLLRRAMDVFRSLRGDHNLDIARTANDLGAVLRAQGHMDEAATLYQRALSIRMSHDGAETLTVAETLNNLAAVYRAQGKSHDAEDALVRALAIRRRQLPEEHPRVAQSIDNLAVQYASSGDYARAIPLMREATGLAERALGPDHPDLAVTLANLGAALTMSGGPADEAESLLRRALAIRRAKLGPSDSRTAYTQSILGRNLLAQRRYAEAATELEEAVAGLEKAGPRLRTRLETAASDLIRVYVALEQVEKANELRARIPGAAPAPAKAR